MDAELEISARRIEMVRNHPAHVRSHDLVAPVGEECARLEAEWRPKRPAPALQPVPRLRYAGDTETRSALQAP